MEETALQSMVPQEAALEKRKLIKRLSICRVSQKAVGTGFSLPAED